MERVERLAKAPASGEPQSDPEFDPSPSVPQRSASHSALVLIVENDPDVRRRIAEALACDYRVATASHGSEGLEKALELRPDLILSDMMMPVMTGDAMVRELREHGEMDAVPIILMTETPDDALRIRMLREGAQDYLRKPILIEELRARAGNLIRMKRARDVLQHELEDRGQGLEEMAREVSRRKRELVEAMAALRESEESFRFLMEGVRDYAIFRLDVEGRVVAWNPGAERLYGYRPDEILGRPVSVLFTEEEARDGVPERELEEAAGKGRVEREAWRVRKDGSRFWGNRVTEALRDEAGRLRGFSRVTRDVTERRLAMTALQQSDSLKRAILETALDAIITMDHEGRIIEFNAAAERTFGYSRAQAIGRSMAELIIPPALRERHREGLARYLATGESRMLGRRIELTAVRADGTEFPVELAITRTSAGEPPLFTGTVRDITERRHAEEELRRRERELSDFMENLALPLHLAGPDGTILWANPAELRMLGYEKDEYVGHNVAEFHADGHVIKDIRRRLWSGETLCNYPVRLRAKGGSIRHALLSANVLFEDGRFVHTRCSTRDVTEQVSAEAEIRELNEELEARVAARTRDLEAANSELEAFAYSISHDLRAPLRAIDGFAAILMESFASQLHPDAQRCLHLVRDNARQMDRLVEHLLAFSRLGRVPLVRRHVDPSKLAREALEELRGEGEGRRVRTVVEDLPPCSGEPALLKQVFVNLLSNAFKYTRKRETAVIEVGCLPASDGLPEPVYFVRDNGVGFDMKYLPKLFGVFQRLHSPEEYEGIGVGLANVQRIVVRHGGRVWAEATEGEGATFYFTIGGGSHG